MNSQDLCGLQAHLLALHSNAAGAVAADAVAADAAVAAEIAGAAWKRQPGTMAGP